MRRRKLFKMLALMACLWCSLGTAAQEAYACYTPSNTTLTFYYDFQRSQRSASGYKTYDLNTGLEEPGWCEDGTNKSVTHVSFKSSFSSARPTTTYAWFKDMENLKTIGYFNECLDMSEVNSTRSMFENCKSLERIDMVGQNMASVTHMGYMFKGCSSLERIDMSNIGNVKVTSMRAMFYGCQNLTSLNLDGFSTAQVRDMSYMFYDCESLKSLNLSGFRTHYVTDMSYMFCACKELTSLDLASFNTSNVKGMSYMFEYCYKLTTIYVDPDRWNTAAVTNSNDMFLKCSDIKGEKGTTYDANHVGHEYARIDGGKDKPGYLTGVYEAYAVYTPSNKTLTFYYDDRRLYVVSQGYATYDLNTGDNKPGWYNDGTNASVTRVVFNSSFALAKPKTTHYWFAGMSSLKTIEGMKEYLRTDDVSSMAYMFYSCQNLTSLDLSSFNTAQVTRMDYMFYSCKGLTSLNLSSFNTAQVTRMDYMFYGCKGLTILDLGSFNTSEVTNMKSMFRDCSNLVTIYVSDAWLTGWRTDAVTQSENMFLGCTSIRGDNGTTYDPNHVDKEYAHIDVAPKNPGYLTLAGIEAYAEYKDGVLFFFYDHGRSSRTGKTYLLNTGQKNPGWYDDGTYKSVSTVVFFSEFAAVRPTTTYRWFLGMENLSLIIDMEEYLNTSEVTNMAGMFAGCTGLTSLDLSGFNTSKVTEMSHMFNGCTNLTTIFVGNTWSTSAVNSSYYMFLDCINILGEKGTTYDANHTYKEYAHIDGGPSNPGYLTSAGTEAYAVYTPSNTTLTFYFDNKRSTRSGTTYDIEEYGIQDWYIDGNYKSVTKVVFDPSFTGVRPIATDTWFVEMENLKSISGMKQYLNTSQVTDMSYMFDGCSSLTSLDLSGFNTSKVTEMRDMFMDCSSLESLNLSGFNTSQVTDMSSMFNGCSSLKSLDVSGFNTAEVEYMNKMFNGCSSLKSLDLRGFNTAQVTDMTYMFRDCKNLTTITVGNQWITAKVTDTQKMFENCTSIKGQMGTTYDANYVGKEYARIDGGPSNPGYLTTKSDAYAVYTPSNTTLTFYYDNKRSSRSGTVYELKTTGNPDWYTDGTNQSVTKVAFDPSFADARPTTTSVWFDRMENLTSITGMKKYLNTSEVTDMSAMFSGCSSLESIDVSGFNTDHVTKMSHMFDGCSSLTNLNLRDFNTSNVTDMMSMFYGCSSLTTLDLSGFNTSQVTEMWCMFANCSKLSTISVADGWSTASVNSSNYMFLNCTSIKGQKGTTYNSSHTNKEYARIDGGSSSPGYLTAAPEAYAVYTSSNKTLTFYCDYKRSSRSGTTYDLNSFLVNPGWYEDGTNKLVTRAVFDPSFANARPTSTYGWFGYMTNLSSITGMKENLNMSQVKDTWAMFLGCTSLASLDLSGMNTSNLVIALGMFYGCSGLTSLDLSSFNTSQIANMSSMFEGCSNLTTIYVGDGWSTAAVTSSGDMFMGCTKLKGEKGTAYSASHVDATYARVDGGTARPGYLSTKISAYTVFTPDDATLTFYYDNQKDSRPGVTYAIMDTYDDAPGWVADGTCEFVTRVVFNPSFASARPSNTVGWFYHMNQLQSITGMKEYLNTSQVKNMSGMFFGSSSLTSIDLSHFDTKNVESMVAMFCDCSGLTRLNLNDFNTGKVKEMMSMFSGCSGLRTLDLRSFNTSKVTDMSTMFYGCSNLTTIYAGSGWSTAAVEESYGMFIDCVKLRGGKGTTYNENHVDAAYAHIDGGLSNPGYFSNKLRGDVNGDGEVSIADINAAIDLILSGSQDVNGDVNDDNEVSVADINAIIDIILSSN